MSVDNLDAILIDFETRSRCDLKLCGVDVYATDPSTDILCLAMYDFTDGSCIVMSANSLNRHEQWVERLNNCEFVMAHNARFDRLIWELIGVEDYKYPDLALDKWYCTMAQMRVNALPAALDKAARALKVKMQKSHKGAALIKQLSIPREDGTFNEDPQLMAEMRDYCLQDVLATVDCVKACRLMTREEHRDYIISEEINDVGVRVDVQAAKLALQYASDEQQQIAGQLTDLTSGVVTKHTQHQRVKEYVLARCGDNVLSGAIKPTSVRDMMTVFKKGEKKTSLAKDIRENILNAADSGDLSIPDDVYNVISLVDDGNKSSVAKFKRMYHMADPEDQRVRGAFMFAGAGQTKRFSSKGMQVHNFTRDCHSADEADALIGGMIRKEKLDDVMYSLSKLLRPAMIPSEGNVFVVGDWSAIEGRILPWLTKHSAAEEVLDVFRNDEDIYLHTAASMRIDDRQIGKVATLALGYQGAIGAFQSMAKNYGLYLPEVEVDRIVKGWRHANPWAVWFWKALEQAALKAIRNPNSFIECGRVKYVYTKMVMGGSLLCVLPSGNIITYPMVKVEDVQTDYGTKRSITYMKASINPKADAKEWPRAALYGGLMAENITQAVAADLLKYVLSEMLDVVLHVHDEIVLDVPAPEAQDAAAELQYVMETNPDWAEGLPLKAEPEIMTRYGK